MTLFADTYLVTDKLETYSHEEVDAAESQLATAFPVGYREYVTTLGKGEYCDHVNVFPPQEIVECFGGYALCYIDSLGQFNLQIAYDPVKYDETAARIAAFLQSKAA